MSKKSEKKNKVATPAAEEKEATPVAAPAKAVQLTPIIQPIAFVPYSSQEQPLYMYDEEVEDEIVEEEEVVVAPAKKKASAAAIILSILSLVIIGIYVAAKFVVPEYLALIDGVSGLDMILNLVETMDFTNIIAVAIAVVPVMAVLTLISSLIRVCKKGACVFAKITTFFGLLAALVALLMALIEGGYTFGYGLYAVAAISLINVLIAYLAKND